MWLVVYMCLYLERLVLLFQSHANGNIKCLVLVCQCIVISILDITTRILTPTVYIDILGNEIGVKIFQYIIFTLKIDYRTLRAFLIYQHDSRHTCLTGHIGIICTISCGSVPVPNSSMSRSVLSLACFIMFFMFIR